MRIQYTPVGQGLGLEGRCLGLSLATLVLDFCGLAGPTPFQLQSHNFISYNLSIIVVNA